MYLLDTNVVSELRRARPNIHVVSWLKGVHRDDLYISAVTIGEIQTGIERTREQDPAKAAQIESWLEHLADSHNVLSMGASAFRVWAQLMHRKSNDLGEDAMIAATAAVHRLTVVTRNTRDFEPFGIPTLNPFKVQE